MFLEQGRPDNEIGSSKLATRSIVGFGLVLPSRQLFSFILHMLAPSTIR
jgi:hypothetical protein